jgi:FMN phosphatase YigB (HAD superfamily)
MRIFFDVDNTIIAWDGTLRPHTIDIFQRLRSEGHHIYIWSGIGLRWEVVKEHHLEPLIETCFIKPVEDYKASLERLGVTVYPEFTVDDHPGVIRAFGGVIVTPYYSRNDQDTEMLRVYQEVQNRLNGNKHP